MRTSAYALANFGVDWASLANSLKSKLPTTATGAAKLGAGIGVGIGGLNYLGSDDKSIGNLASNVVGGAAVGGAVGYGGMSLKDAYKSKKSATTGSTVVNNVPTFTPVNISNPNNILNNSSQSVSTSIPNTSSSLVAPLNYQNPQPLSNNNPAGTYNVFNPNTTGVGTEQISPISQLRRPDIRLKKYPQGRYRSGNLGTEESKFTSPFANFSVRRYNGFLY